MRRKTRFFLLAVTLLGVLVFCTAMWAERKEEEVKSVFVKETVYAESRI